VAERKQTEPESERAEALAKLEELAAELARSGHPMSEAALELIRLRIKCEFD
jgi:hypothetical protein